MNNNEIINPYEGQKVGEFIWPFHRFSAVIPNQIGGDIFVWLYLSLVVYANESKNLPKDNYNDDAKREAQKLINEKFSNIIDPQTLEKIVSNAEKDFVIDRKTIKQDTFSFLDTYENLFSESCETRMVYQDAVTGEVLPFFGDTSNIEDYHVREDDNCKKFNYRKVKDPSGKAIKKAYSQYMKLKKFNIVSEDIEPELNNEFFDEDEQTFLDNGAEEERFVQEKKELKSLRDMDVIPVQDTKVDINVLVPVYIRDNSIVARSPFGPLTDNWLNKCLLKCRNISEDVDEKIKNIEKSYCIANTTIRSYIESHKNDFASTLKYCQTLYRVIDSMNDNQMRLNVIELDTNMAQGKNICYFYAGRIIDGLMKTIESKTKTTIDRSQTDVKCWRALIDKKCQNTSVKYQLLMTDNVYNHWKKKYCKRDGTLYYHFQAYLADVILETSIMNSPNMYNSFFEDLVYVYSLRNAVDHNEDNIPVKPETIDKLTKAVRVLFELI